MTTKEAQIALANLKLYISGGGAVDRSTNKAIDMAIKALWESEPHWIPVTERLPNIQEDVLVSYYDEVMVGWLNDDSTWFAEGFGRLNMNDISAWMPLPEPYKGVNTWTE